jgi:hypothetical protein
MPSPDVRKYVDLTLYDLESQSIYLNALNYARIALPEFQPREGSIETVLLQAMAVEVAELVRSINRVPGGVLQVLLRLFDVQRSEGTFPTAVIRISGADTTTYELPSGARFFYQSGLDADPLILSTDSVVDLTWAKTVSTAVVVSNVVTVTTATRHGFTTGQTITLAGFVAPDTTLNGSFTVTVTGDYTFTFSLTKTNTTVTPTAATATPPSTHPATAFVSATGTAVTEAFNGLATGTALSLLSVIPQVASAKLATAVSGGALAETDDEYFARASAQLARLTSTLVTADNFVQWAAQNEDFSYVYRVTALDATDRTRTAAAGYLTLVAAPIDASSTNLLTGTGDPTTATSSPSWGQKDDLRLAADQMAHLDLTVAVVDPMLVTVKVATTLKAVTNVTATTASLAVSSDLSALISPNSWDWSPVLRRNELIGLIARSQTDDLVTVADYVVSVTTSVTGSYIPDGKVVGTVASSSYATTTLTVNTSGNHGLSNLSAEYVAIKVAGVWETYQATYVSATSFTVVRATTASPTNWVKVATVDATTGDLTVNDPAPLLVSGSHEITVT